MQVEAIQFEGFGFRQFRDHFCLSYILFDSATRAALVIDPSVALMPDYRHFLAERGLKPVWVIDTHLHSEHFSATQIFGKEYGSKIGMGAATRSQRVTERLSHGGTIALGTLQFEVLLTPGHSPDSLSLALNSGLVFTGDALLMADANPPELFDADAQAQWNTFHEVFAKLPDETVVLPAHDASDLLFSTLGTERRKNVLWNIKNALEYKKSRRLLKIINPVGDTAKILDYNVAAESSIEPQKSAGKVFPYGERNPELDRQSTISIQKFSAKVKKPESGALILDVRELEEFKTGQIRGSVNIPASELGVRISEIKGIKKIFVIGQTDGTGTLVARTLSYIGLADVWLVEGGVRAWMQAGYGLEDAK